MRSPSRFLEFRQDEAFHASLARRSETGLENGQGLLSGSRRFVHRGSRVGFDGPRRGRHRLLGVGDRSGAVAGAERRVVQHLEELNDQRRDAGVRDQVFTLLVNNTAQSVANLGAGTVAGNLFLSDLVSLTTTGALSATGSLHFSLPAGDFTTHAGDPWNYRNRTRMKVRTVDSGFAMGYYQFGSHQLLSVEQCPISSLLINRAIQAIWDLGKGGKVVVLRHVEA